MEAELNLSGNRRALLDKLRAHQQQVINDPSTPVDTALFRQCEILLVPFLEEDKSLLAEVIAELCDFMMKHHQGLETVIQLLMRLVESLSFSDVLNFDPPVDLVAGLQLEGKPFNLLVLKLLEKGLRSPKDAASIAATPGILLALVNLWLYTDVAETASKTEAILVGLLKVDKEPAGISVHGVGMGVAEGKAGQGQGLVWRRLFGDKDVYGTMYYVCKGDPTLSKARKTTAQGRLLDFVASITKMDFDYVKRSHHPEIEGKYGLEQGTGLLDFAACHMTDFRSGDDILMDMTTIRFYTELLQVDENEESGDGATKSLEFLQERGIHNLLIGWWLRPDYRTGMLDLAFIKPAAAKYVGQYTYNFSGDFLRSTIVREVLANLVAELSRTDNQWAQGDSPAGELHILSSLPGVALLPQNFFGVGRNSNPLFLVPTNVTNADSLKALAYIFRGPDKLAGPDASEEEQLSLRLHAAAARAAFLTYFSNYRDELFKNLVTHASRPAVPDKAVAAINVMQSILSSNWATPPNAENLYSDEGPPAAISHLPNEEKLEAMVGQLSERTRRLPKTGFEVLRMGRVLRVVFPFLLDSLETQGGPGAQMTSAVKEVVEAKHGLLMLFQAMVKEDVAENPGRSDHLLDSLQQRVLAGPYGSVTLRNEVAVLEQ